MLYCDAPTLTRFFDERSIRDLLSDDGAPYDGDLALNATLETLLQAASGRLEAACYFGGLYTADDLANLPANSQALAAEICARLAMAALLSRRAKDAELATKLEQSAEEYLGQLRDGKRLFDLPAQKAAGHPFVAWPSIRWLNAREAVTDRTPHFYPRASDRLPADRRG